MVTKTFCDWCDKDITLGYKEVEIRFFDEDGIRNDGKVFACEFCEKHADEFYSRTKKLLEENCPPAMKKLLGVKEAKK